jgi:hypothetical protein
MEPAPDTTSKSAAKALLKLIGRYGIPEMIQSDQGSQYASDVIKDLLLLLNISRQFTLQYNPKANGVVERQNQEVMKHLKAIVLETGVKRVWSLYLPLVQRVINTSIHSATGTSPARIVFGDNVYLDRGINEEFQPNYNKEVITYEDHIQDLNEQLIEIACASIMHQRTVFDKKLAKSPAHPTKFSEGTLVLVSYHEKPPDKLTSFWKGPQVVQRVDNQTYYCQDLLTLAVNPFHLTRLKRFLSSADFTMTKTIELAARDRDEIPVLRI